jgi:hypothetical protein
VIDTAPERITLLWGLVDVSWLSRPTTWGGMVTVASLVGATVILHDDHGRHLEVGLRLGWLYCSIDIGLYPELP